MESPDRYTAIVRKPRSSTFVIDLKQMGAPSDVATPPFLWAPQGLKFGLSVYAGSLPESSTGPVAADRLRHSRIGMLYIKHGTRGEGNGEDSTVKC